MQYKQVVIARKGGPEVLEVVTRDLQEPGPGQVRIKVLASGVAYADVAMRYGMYPGAPPFPFAPGYDVVGQVDVVGEGVSGWHAGQKVAALTVTGSYAEYMCLPADELVPVPSGLDATQAVSVVLNYTTAYQMLHRVAQVPRGGRMLVHGAAGGVGTALLELGGLHRLEMLGTASKGKHDLVESLGATPIDYKREDFVARTLALTGDGVDAVYDHIGGAHLSRSYRTLRSGGTLVSYGVYDAQNASMLKYAGHMLRLLWLKLLPGKGVSFYGIAQFKKQHPDWFREDLQALFDWLAAGKIAPVIADQIPLEKAAQAHDLLENASVRGKLVLVCCEED
jgi:NADPH:quinone reductase-like Zn-dependent oxidoreductase